LAVVGGTTQVVPFPENIPLTNDYEPRLRFTQEKPSPQSIEERAFTSRNVF